MDTAPDLLPAPAGGGEEHTATGWNRRVVIRWRPSFRTVVEMFLALKEMRRAKVRFGLLIVAIGLLVFLILFQQSLQNSRLRGFTGALRTQSAPVLVYSTDGQRTLQRAS